MPYRVTFEAAPSEAVESYQDRRAMLECLVAINTNYLVRRVGWNDRGQNPAVPLLGQIGAHVEKTPGPEFWRDIPTTLRMAREGGGSNYEDLLCWQIAEQRVRFGVPAEIPILVNSSQAAEDVKKGLRITLELGVFNGLEDAAESHEDLGYMLDCLIAIDTNYLVRRVGWNDQGMNPAVPLLYRSGVKYEEEPIGAEFWRDIPTVLHYAAQGSGSDCEDLVCYQVSELRVRFGIPAQPIILPQYQPKEQSFLYHIQTWMPSGPDDPSARLGMLLDGQRVCLPDQANCSGVKIFNAR